MPTRHKSAMKQYRQSLKRQAQNREVRSSMRTEVRKLREAVAAKDVAIAQTRLRTTAKSLTKAATKKVIHRNAASRTIARLSKQVAAIAK